MTDIEKLQAAAKLIDSILVKYKPASAKFRPSANDQFIRMGLVRTYEHIGMILDNLEHLRDCCGKKSNLCVCQLEPEG